MKRYNRIMVVILFIFQLVGCTGKNVDKSSVIKPPENNNLVISGRWSINDFKILDDKKYNKENLDDIKANTIVIRSSQLEIGGKSFTGIKYKLKVVDSTYNISYEGNYKVSDLKLDSDRVEVISIIHQNNIIGEFIVVNEQEGYLYYQGVLLKLFLEGKVEDNKKESIESQQETLIIKEDQNNSNNSEGLYLGIKTTSEDKYSEEKYRTLWISTKQSQLQEIKEKDNIIFPRLNGIWKLEPENINDIQNDVYYEYFKAKPIGSNLDTSIIISGGTKLYRSINFVGNDYVATEVIEKNKESEIYSSAYQVLPIDSLHMNKGVLISDLYTKEINKTYESIYEQVYASLSLEQREKLSKYISFSNFSMGRNNGKWVLKGGISAVGNAEPYDFNTGIKPNKTLINYDTLVIPWKTLKGELPLLVDAFTSPDGSLAIIVMENELLIYSINNGTLADRPMKRISLNEGDQIIMAEWCSADYVDKWGNVFEENSRIIE